MAAFGCPLDLCMDIRVLIQRVGAAFAHSGQKEAGAAELFAIDLKNIAELAGAERPLSKEQQYTAPIPAAAAGSC